MKKYLLFALLFGQMRCLGEAVVTTNPIPWLGRLGDQLIHYVRAKWVVHTHNLPFFYRPFDQSNQLRLYYQEKRFIPTKHNAHPKIVRSESDIKSLRKGTYAVDFSFKQAVWQDWDEVATWQDVFADKQFMHMIKNMIYPLDHLPLLSLPQDIVTVALHVRKGGGYDWPVRSDDSEPMLPNVTYWDQACPLKFPPNQYYLDQIRKLDAILGGVPLYIYLFTDDPHPEALVKKYQEALQLPHITFACRERGNSYNAHVLEDLFNMARFDCLIRSGSHFSQIAHVIGDHRIVLYPKHAVWQGDTLVIDDAGVFVADEAFIMRK